MSQIVIVTGREAVKLIRPGAVKRVRVLFQACTGHASLVRAPKSHVRRMLQQLPDGATVTVEIMTGLGEATIAGFIGPLAAQVSEAAAVARRLL